MAAAAVAAKGGSLDELVRSRSISASMEARVKAPVPQPPPTPSTEMVVANKGSWCMPGRGGARSVELTAAAASAAAAGGVSPLSLAMPKEFADIRRSLSMADGRGPAFGRK